VGLTKDSKYAYLLKSSIKSTIHYLLLLELNKTFDTPKLNKIFLKRAKKCKACKELYSLPPSLKKAEYKSALLPISNVSLFPKLLDFTCSPKLSIYWDNDDNISSIPGGSYNEEII
jgi:hypothetical protein